MSADEVDLLKWPDPLPAAWQAAEVPAAGTGSTAYEVTEDGQPRGRVEVRFAAASDVGAAYPAGVRDRLLEPPADAPAAALQLVSEAVMAADPACRRLVLAVPEGDIAQVARGEEAGYRYVVDVDLPRRSVSLLAAEPEWVLEQSRHLDDVPTH
jgi:hypothetical protein